MPSACSSKTHSPMPCASSTLTRFPHRSALRSISIWHFWSWPAAAIASWAAACVAIDDAQARQIFRNLIDMPADVTITDHVSAGAFTDATYSEKIIIRYDGNVGIGYTSPGSTLDVNGQVLIATT